MREGLLKALLKTREGLIFISASFIYLAIGFSVQLLPSIAAIFGFVGFMAFYMPIILLLFFFKIHGFRADFQSTWWSSSAIVFAALIPFMAVAKTAILN